MYWIVRGSLWFGIYLVLVLFPLLIGAVVPGDSGGRPFLTQFGVACGFVGLSVMAFEYALLTKVKTLAGAFGEDALLKFHKLMGMLASALLLMHAALMMQAGYPVEWLNPFHEESPWAMRWGVVAGLLLLLLIGLSLGRRAIRLAYDWWQLTHAWLADAVVLMGLAHVLLFGGFSSAKPMKIAFAAYYVILLSLGVYFKLVRPIQLWGKRWKVVENRQEKGSSRTLVLAPYGHDGFVFEPGQFAWLSTGKTPFHKDRHPISFSSCAYDRVGANIAFTIRDLGDWSGTIVPKLEPGTMVWVDGPHGVFTADREQGMGYVLIGGGVGITPMMSICSTLAERGDPREVILFYAGRDFDSMMFTAEFEALQSKLNLRIVYVLERPPVDWQGESGYLNAAILGKYLPDHFRRYHYFICGPVPMMNAVEDALPKLDVPAGHIHSERFDMV